MSKHKTYEETLKESESSKQEIKEYATFDEIPVPETKIVQPISFEGLPKYNWIYKLQEYISSNSDTYPEYIWQNGISTLSCITRRRLYTIFDGRIEYLNIWALSLGVSTLARKTVSMDYCMDIISGIFDGENIFLSFSGSKEGFYNDIADTIFIDGEDKSPIRNPKLPKRSQLPLWIDEAGRFFANLDTQYNAGAKDVLCKLYDGASIERNNSGKSISINKPYFCMNLSSTPVAFSDNIVPSDLETGFFARFNIVNPTYDKRWRAREQDADKTNEMMQLRLIDDLSLINQLLPENGIRVVLNKTCVKLWNDYCEEREKFFARTKNTIMNSSFGRMQNSVLRMAILIELGNVPYFIRSFVRTIQDYTKDKKSVYYENFMEMSDIILKISKPLFLSSEIANIYISIYNYIINNYKLSRLCLSVSSLKYSMYLHDSMYLPYSNNLKEEMRFTEKENYIEKIYKIMAIKRKITRSELLKKMKCSCNDLDKYIQVMKDGETIIEYKVMGVKKPTVVYVYHPSDVENFTFNTPPKDVPEEIEDLYIKLSKKQEDKGDTL